MKISDLTKEEFPQWPAASFLQSAAWARIQTAGGQKVVSRKIEIKGQPVGYFMALEKELPFKRKYWYLPRGPVIFSESAWSWSDFFSQLSLHLDPAVVFVRLEPTDSDFNAFLLESSLALEPSLDLQPRRTSILDLSPSSDEILKKMSAKTRYNIRLAEKKGIEVGESDIKDWSDFWRLMSSTARRDKFSLHSHDYYRNLIVSGQPLIKFFSARREGRMLAAGLFSFFGQTVSYLHGASDYEQRQLMAPHLLQWKLIQKAQAEGYKYYDFYGVDDEKWPGVSRFKKGFQGRDFSYPGTYDFILDRSQYLRYEFIRRINRLIRRV